MNLSLLETFCRLHATPGDEGAVFDELLRHWRTQGLDTRRLGPYAVLAEPGERKKSDTLLLVAHADSPGFCVCATPSPTELHVITLGGIHPKGGERLCLKTTDGLFTGILQPPPEAWTRTEPLTVLLDAPCPAAQKGDRLCWAFSWEEADGKLHAPFLDNRIACALIAEWYTTHAHLLADFNVLLAATAMEEVNGFGANVLARNVSADAVIILDVTYTSASQGVSFGAGPVLTLSDASILLAPALRDRLLATGLPLQTEVYNFSGTDARAFPVQGHTCPVCPVLLPTEGNHSPRETIAIADLHAWPATIAAVAKSLCEPLKGPRG